jgi:membrane associated rhomboid family serine protease
MIPIQDVVPSGQTPTATLVVIALNVVFFGIGVNGYAVPAPFTHTSVTPLALSLLFLWLFGDNVEARLGKLGFAAVYLLGGWIAGVGAAGAVTAIIGSYFVMLPQSRMLTLAPPPAVLVEVPAAFFLGVWAVLNVLQFVRDPRTIWMFALAFAIGAAVTRLMRPRVRW